MLGKSRYKQGEEEWKGVDDAVENRWVLKNWFHDKTLVIKEKYILLLLMLIFGTIMCACRKNNETIGEAFTENTKEAVLGKSANYIEKKLRNIIEKGYNLPILGEEREEAEIDCKRVMELIFDIYEQADKGGTSNVILSDKTVLEIQTKVMETGCPVRTTVIYSNMENHEEMDQFLKVCGNGKASSIVTYEVCSDGGIIREKYIFDGKDMYVLTANTIWDQDTQPMITDISYSRMKEWRYTDKGWFCYELCVPEPPEVSEIVDGSCLFRIEPMTKEQQEMSKKCVSGLGYQGNNLLCSNWDTDYMEDLDYNGMYEYLYAMKYQKKFPSEDYPNGIPKNEFENLIMEYLPITAQQIREYAVFDEENQTYVWLRLGCFNYAPTFFGTSLPEVTDIKENEDGTVTLTVDAVCDMVICNEAVITSELTIRFSEDGSFQYLGNKILDDGIYNVPEYQYRIDV